MSHDHFAHSDEVPSVSGGVPEPQEKKRETMPVQINRDFAKRGAAPTAVVMRAYEVYCHVYGPQEAMVVGGCRGGFGTGELIAMLYAHSFPQEEWRGRMNEAFRGLDV